MSKKEKGALPVIPIRVVNGRTDEEQVNWTLAHANLNLRFRAIGECTDDDGTRYKVFGVTGFGAKKLARMFDRDFWGGDGKHYIMSHKE